MFGIRSLSAKAQADPLQSQRAATAWFAQLPSIDVIVRAEQVALALDALRQSDVAIDRDRVAAIASLNAATEADSRRLIAWYLKNQEKSPSVADHWRRTPSRAKFTSASDAIATARMTRLRASG